MKKGYKKLIALLQQGWREVAKSERALQRSGRYIKTADDLVNVVFLYQTDGGVIRTDSSTVANNRRIPADKKRGGRTGDRKRGSG